MFHSRDSPRLFLVCDTGLHLERNDIGFISVAICGGYISKYPGLDVKLWTSFWEHFKVVIHESELPDIPKLTYLRSLRKGEAKLSIRGLALASANYTVAIDILKKRFGRTECIIFSHIEELLTISVPSSIRLVGTSCGFVCS